MDFAFWLNSVLLGAGLAADAFSVSVADGLSHPQMPRSKSFLIAGTFAAFQFLMPVIGWFCVRTVVQTFSRVQIVIPYIALVLLLYIGGKMIWESFRRRNAPESVPRELSVRTLLVQGIATSIDALSVGFTIENDTAPYAFAAAAVIGGVTFALCLLGVRGGRKFGEKLRFADRIGGLILIGIGLEIFIKGVFFS